MRSDSVLVCQLMLTKTARLCLVLLNLDTCELTWKGIFRYVGLHHQLLFDSRPYKRTF